MKFVNLALSVLTVTMCFIFGGSTANASPLQYKYDFIASDFSTTFFIRGKGWFTELRPQIKPIIGSITVTFDQAEYSGGGMVDAITLDNGTHVFEAGEVGFISHYSDILFGGLVNEINVTGSDTDDFWLNFLGYSNPEYSDFLFTNSPRDPAGSSFFTRNVQVNVSVVPEPATIALFSLGLIGFAAARRRKQ